MYMVSDMGFHVFIQVLLHKVIVTDQFINLEKPKGIILNKTYNIAKSLQCINPYYRAFLKY